MSASKKIVIVQDYLRNGGTERQSVFLARAFAGAGHEVALLTFRPGGALMPGATGAGAFRCVALQPFDTGLDFFAPRLCAVIRRLAPDVVLCMGRMANCKAGRLARAFPGVAVISTMRTGKELPRAYARSLRETRCAVANSHEAARVLREQYGVPAEKIAVIRNALAVDVVDVSRAGSPCHECHESAGAAPAPRLLCVAMFRPEKNHRELLEIFSRLRARSGSGSWTTDHGLELHLVGDGPELAPCRALAGKLGIAGRVYFHGCVADPAPFYRQGGIAVLASRRESLPNFLVEAHAHGIPSVAYGVGGVAECGGVAIAPGDQAGFLAALERAVTDGSWRAAESARVAAYAREHFSPGAQVHCYLELLKKITSGRLETENRF